MEHSILKRAGRLHWICAIIITWVTMGPVEAGDAGSFDHSHALWDQVLEQHVRKGLVDYSSLKKQPEPLNRYLDQLAAVSRDQFSAWSEPQQIAFLINLYNASTLHLIVKHYPVASIKEIGWVFNGPFDQDVVRLFGEKTDLNEVEHGILRTEYNEPRIHFALVCAALSCPKLRSEPYVGPRLNDQLEHQGRSFLRNEKKNRVDVKKRVVHLSPIFKWFREDFVEESGSLSGFVRPYFPEAAQLAMKRGDFEIRYTEYDWSLNDLKLWGRR